MFSDPVNFIDPTGKLLWNVVGTIVGGVLGGYDAYMNNASVTQIIGSTITGAVGGFVEGGTRSFATVYAFVNNIAGQINDPNFKGVNYTQAIVAAFLGGTGLSSKVLSKIQNKFTMELLKSYLDKGIIFTIDQIEADLKSCLR